MGHVGYNYWLDVLGGKGVNVLGWYVELPDGSQGTLKRKIIH